MFAPRRHTDSRTLKARFAAVRAELGIEESFSEEVLNLAATRSDRGPIDRGERDDQRHLPIIAIDPPGATDIDQAFHLERAGSGYTFWYAIADLDAWIEPGDPIDNAARSRGVTIYSPDGRVPLHPAAISEGSASLLPGVDRTALMWRIELDQHGAMVGADLRRALVNNRAARTYGDVQSELDDGTIDESLRLLEEIGELRIEQEKRRGGVSLELPEQRVLHTDGRFEIEYEPTRHVETWNAQLSLCCGMAAARLMVDSGTGILRTLPPASGDTFDDLRRRSLAFDVPWPADLTYPDWVRALDPTVPTHAALMAASTATFRGAGYLAFDGDLQAEHNHAAIAAPYAHVTAPLRRLIDRFTNECVLAACEGRRPAQWLLESLDELPSIMGSTTQKAASVDRRSLDLVEAAILSSHIGDVFDAVVTGERTDYKIVQLLDPAVIAKVAPEEFTLGESVRVRLTHVDENTGSISFARA